MWDSIKNNTQSEYNRKLACGFNIFLSPKCIKLTEFSLLTKNPIVKQQHDHAAFTMIQL